MKNSLALMSFLCLGLTAAFGQPGHDSQKQQPGQPTTAVNGKLPPLDVKMIEEVMGLKGVVNGNEYKVTVPQHDLKVVVDGFKIIPAMGLGTWVAFTPAPQGAMIMGDIIVTETDLGPVQREAVKQGLTISAIHNHFVRNHPNVMYMHIDGMGSTRDMAQKAKAVLDKVSESRGGKPSAAAADSVANTLDTKALDDILSAKGEANKGVYKYTLGRPDVNLIEHGLKVSTFLGFNTWASWQGSPDKAAVCGDFAMLENEVDGVVKTLIENGIEVVALHNHMVHEQPRIFFLHYWGVGRADQLARGLKAAINMTGKSKPATTGNMSTH